MAVFISRQLLQAELDADGEEQEHDAELRRRVDQRRIVHQAERVGADHHPGDEEADDGHQAEAEADVGDGGAGEDQRHRVGEDGLHAGLNHSVPPEAAQEPQQKPLGMRPFSRASRSSASRKSGCAIEISACARSATDLPFRFTMPYSVTTYMTSVRGVVTMLPGVSVDDDAALPRARPSRRSTTGT